MEDSLHQSEAMRGSTHMSLRSSSVLIRTLLIVTVLAGAIGLQSESSYSFSRHEKAFYASANVTNFVRPGLVFKVASAAIAQDGTITARVLVTDPAGCSSRSGWDPDRRSSFHQSGCSDDSERSGAIRLLHDASADQSDYEGVGYASRRRFGWSVRQERHRRLYLHLQDEGAQRIRCIGDSHHRSLWFTQSDRVRSGHQLRFYDLQLCSERRGR